jgi:hypothetical protein
MFAFFVAPSLACSANTAACSHSGKRSSRGYDNSGTETANETAGDYVDRLLRDYLILLPFVVLKPNGPAFKLAVLHTTMHVHRDLSQALSPLQPRTLQAYLSHAKTTR